MTVSSRHDQPANRRFRQYAIDRIFHKLSPGGVLILSAVVIAGLCLSMLVFAPRSGGPSQSSFVVATAKASWKIRSLEPTADIELLKVDLGPDKSKEPDLRGRVLLLVSSKAINRSGDGGPS